MTRRPTGLPQDTLLRLTVTLQFYVYTSQFNLAERCFCSSEVQRDRFVKTLMSVVYHVKSHF